MIKFEMVDQKKIVGGLVAIIGFMLSPISWWNDLLVNIPLAYLMASPLGLINKKFFVGAFVLSYWLTNLLGFVLMHFGGLYWRGKTSKMLKQLIIENFPMTIVYTLGMVVLVKIGWVKLPWEYFNR